MVDVKLIIVWAGIVAGLWLFWGWLLFVLVT